MLRARLLMLPLIVALELAVPAWAMAAGDYPICGSGRRVTCVVDGDTFWLRGEKIRISNIDAPEMAARCEAELQRAIASTLRLAQLLGTGRLQIRREGNDVHGRTLATIRIGGQDIGDRLVAEGLARTWSGRREPWC